MQDLYLTAKLKFKVLPVLRILVSIVDFVCKGQIMKLICTSFSYLIEMSNGAQPVKITSLILPFPSFLGLSLNMISNLRTPHFLKHTN